MRNKDDTISAKRADGVSATKIVSNPPLKEKLSYEDISTPTLLMDERKEFRNRSPKVNLPNKPGSWHGSVD